MTITTTALGTHTKQFSMSAELGMSGLVSAVDTWVTTASQPGWVLHDSVTSASGGVVTKVYKSLNKDGLTYKYIILKYELVTWKLYTSSCESWDAGTHVPTNEVNPYCYSMPIGLMPNASDLVVFASPRWMLFQGFIRNDPGPWHGVVEVEREAPEDTAAAGYPCWAWINSITFMQAMNASSGSADSIGTGYFACSFPRTRQGYTGVQASNNFRFPWLYDLNAGTTNQIPMDLLAAQTYGTSYGWDTNKKILRSIRALMMTGAQTLSGRFFGLKVIPPTGDLMNKVTVPVDSDKFFSPSGTNADHWILNTTGRQHNAAVTVGTGGGLLSNTQSIGIGSTIANAATCMVSDGLGYYIACNNNPVARVDAATGSVTTIANTSGVTAMVFDGGRYIYGIIHNTTSLVRIDTQSSDAVSTLALPAAGGMAIGQDENYVFVGKYSNTTTPSIYQVSKSTFDNVRTINASTTVGTGLTVMSICPDWEGNIYWVMQSTSSSDTKIFKNEVANGNGTFITGATSATTVLNGKLYYNGGSKKMFSFHCMTSSYQWGEPGGTYYTVNSVNATNNAYNNEASLIAIDGTLILINRGANSATNGSRMGPSLSNGYPANGTQIATGVPGSVGGTTYNFAYSDGVRIFQVDNSSYQLHVRGGFFNKYQRGNAVANGQFLLPV